MRARVEGITPSAPARGLLQVAQVVDYDDPIRWGSGIEVDAPPCGCATTWAPDCEVEPDDNPVAADVIAAAGPGPQFDSFTVEHVDACSTLGRAPSVEQEQSARTSFEAMEPAAIEAEFWTGALLADSPHLASPTADEPNPQGVEVVDAVATLESAIAEACRAGVIHVTPAAATWMARFHLLTREGGRHYTPLGTPVAVGSGYPGTGPDGEEAPEGFAWMYATGPIRVHRAPIRTTRDIDHEVNREVVRVDRLVLVEWDQCIHTAQLAWLGHTYSFPGAIPGSGSGS